MARQNPAPTPMSPEEEAQFQAQISASMKKSKVNEMTEFLTAMATQANRLATDLTRRASEMKTEFEADPNVTDATQKFSWAMNDVENFMRNLNFSQAMSLASSAQSWK